MATNLDTKSLSTLLREQGCMVTPSRLAVLKYLQKNQRPLSPKKISNALVREVNQATVYRILKTLKKIGLVRQIDLQHDHTHFELIRPHDHHHHFVCQDCGSITDVANCNIANLITKIRQRIRGVGRITEHSLELFGLCRTCLKKQ